MSIFRVPAVGLVLCLVLSGLQGCATPYQPAEGSLTGGFGEKRISDSAFWVYFSGNGYAHRDRVENFWLNRCAELTIQQGYRYMVLRPGENAPVGLPDAPVKPAAYIDNGFAPRVNPALYFPSSGVQLTPVRGGGGGGHGGGYVVVGGGGVVTRWSSKGTVLMYGEPLAEEVIWAYDAQKILDLLKPYVSTDGEQPAPSLSEIVHLSLVAHEQIGFAQSAPPLAALVPAPVALPPVAPPPVAPPAADEPESASDAAPAPAPAPAPATAPRSGEELTGWLDNHVTTFHALYRQRVQIEHRVDAGSVTVSFSITPNGSPVDCQMMSTSFPDRKFADAVALQICKMSFSPRDVVQTDVPPLTITFTPLPPASPMI